MTIPPPASTSSFKSRRSIAVTSGMVLLCSLAALFFAWPACRAFLNVVLDEDEGWNACFADAAMGRMPLYPSPDKLITNNYPPLSFYVVGALGRVVGDNVIAGRILSLAAVIALGLAIAGIIIRLGGSRFAAAVGGAYFVATMSRFFTGYVGMNDPQLLAHALMTSACFFFAGAMNRKGGYVLPVLAMVFAGFFKHNIITIPLAAMAWLAMHERRQFVKCAALAGAAIAAGFTACHLIYGPDFLYNFRTPRTFSIKDRISAIPHLRWVAVALAVWIYPGWRKRADRRIQFCNLLVVTGFLVFLLENCGSGVDVNAQFDLVISLSISLGVAYSLVEEFPIARWFTPDHLRTTLLLLICAGFAFSTKLECVRLITDPIFRNYIVGSESKMAGTVAQVREIKGDVYCDPMVLYRAGKPYVVDIFNTDERIQAGRLPDDIVDKKINSGELEYVADPDNYIVQEQAP